MDSQYGLPVSTDDETIIRAIDHFHHQVISSGTSGGQIIDDAAKHPDNLCLQAYASAFNLYAQSDEATTAAKEYLTAAEKQLADANDREKLLLAGIKQWMNLDYLGAIEQFKQMTALYPQDTLALKFAEWLYYCSGQQFTAKDYVATCEKMRSTNVDDPWFLSMYSFALELDGQLDAARKQAERSIELDAGSAWAHHTLAHYYINHSDIDLGIEQLSLFQPTWETILPMLKGHNTWHLALLYVARRDAQSALALLPNIFGTYPNITLEHLDAISLLWRMDMAGLEHPGYADIVSHFGNLPFQQYSGFNSLHYTYGLAKSGDNTSADKAIVNIKRFAASLTNSQQKTLWTDLITPLCEGTQAFANENWQAAYDHYSPVIAKCIQVGGSDAQDELFMQAYFYTLLKLGKSTEAKTYFDQHLKHYTGTALAEYWFGL